MPRDKKLYIFILYNKLRCPDIRGHDSHIRSLSSADGAAHSGSVRDNGPGVAGIGEQTTDTTGHEFHMCPVRQRGGRTVRPMYRSLIVSAHSGCGNLRLPVMFPTVLRLGGASKCRPKSTKKNTTDPGIQSI